MSKTLENFKKTVEEYLSGAGGLMLYLELFDLLREVFGLRFNDVEVIGAMRNGADLYVVIFKVSNDVVCRLKVDEYDPNETLVTLKCPSIDLSLTKTIERE